MTKLRIAAAGFAIAALGAGVRIASAQAGYGYSHVTALEGGASVLSQANGRVEAQLNLPLSSGDELTTYAGARLEIELADGNRIQLDGESRMRLDALAGETADSPQESALTLLEGSLAAESVPLGEQRAFRIDTGDASVYMPGEARVRINASHHRGTNVIVRLGQVEVQTRSGSSTIEAGQYLSVEGDEPAEIARGTFSRDRFDIWVADRTSSVLDAYNSTTSRYTDEAYAGDTAVLDGYGQWDYSPTYDTTVWRPAVADGWTPYSDGYWYDTPVGATWVSYEPWGWFPFHYGNWFFDAAFNSWCWAPAYVYSPAWVYWAYTSSYLGWCPIGWYSYYSPYHRYWGQDSWRSGVYISVGGVFDCARVDLGRGWNFVGVGDFGRRFRRSDVIPAASVRGRLGATVAISSDPVLVSGRAGMGAAALRAFARNAPAVIASRSSRSRSADLAPYLARQTSLPAATVNALRQTAIARVDEGRARLDGPGAQSLPARPAPLSARGFAGRGGPARLPSAAQPLQPGETRELGSSRPAPRGEAWRMREAGTGAGRRPADAAPSAPFRSRGNDLARPGPAPRPGDSWRNRPSSSPPSSENRRLVPRGPSGELWRGRPADSRLAPDRPAAAPAPDRRPEAWRERVIAPPARRVIEGIDRGRAVAPPDRGTAQPQTRSFAPGPRSYEPRSFEPRAPAPRSYAPAAPRSEARPAPRSYSAPPRMSRAPSAPARAPNASPRPSGSHGRSHDSRSRH